MLYVGFIVVQSAVEDTKQSEDDKEEMPTGKPIASHIISGTGWHVVWTDTSKFFFFNPTSKTSIWERPVELIGNVNVDEIISAGPSGRKTGEKSLYSFELSYERAFPWG